MLLLGVVCLQPVVGPSTTVESTGRVLIAVDRSASMEATDPQRTPLEKIHLAFYQDGRMNDNNRWHFWRLEGPGFVWNYRVLPHVHCYVNIAVPRNA